MAPPTGLNWPDLQAYKSWARIYDTSDDVSIQEAIDAVKIAVVARCPGLQTIDCPNDARIAVLLWVNRLLSRRNSPDGVVGVGDLGIATVARADRDILQMLSPWWTPVLA